MEFPASQASSHFPVEPVSASVLVDAEVRRRNTLRELGGCKTGCGEVDDYVLLGGFERGCVVGLTAEDEELGLLLGMQMLVHTMCDEGPASQKALIITPKPTNVILGTLRACLAKELAEQAVPPGAVRGRMKDCLDRIMLSCVFDIDGLGEVLADLDKPDSESGSQQDARRDAPQAEPAEKIPEREARQVSEEALSSPLSSPMSSPPSSWRPATPDIVPSEFPVSEIQDSQDEGLSSPSSASRSPQPEVSRPQLKPETVYKADKEVPSGKSLPHLILVTHFSSLLTGLFTHREKSAAHTALQLLGSHMRYLSRSLPSSPLIMLLNSTTTSVDPAGNPDLSAAPGADKAKPLDPTLCSVFNPPTLPLAGPHYAAGAGTARRNKPRFGLIFAQLLDMHLLGTRAPRSKEDADLVYAAPSHARPGEEYVAQRSPRFVTVLEVLLDDIGVWEGKTGPRMSREQRWAAVDVVGGRVVDAFAEKEKVTVHEEIRLATGLGGPRV